MPGGESWKLDNRGPPSFNTSQENRVFEVCYSNMRKKIRNSELSIPWGRGWKGWVINIKLTVCGLLLSE